MKKITTFFLAIFLSVTLAACGGKETPSNIPTGEEAGGSPSVSPEAPSDIPSKEEAAGSPSATPEAELPENLSEGSTVMDESKMTFYGRTYVKNDILYLFWTNSGFSVHFEGTGVTANLMTDNLTNIYLGYLNVYVDGEFEPSKTICVTQGMMEGVVLAENLSSGEHTIEVRKRNEAAYGGSATIGVSALSITEGSLLDPPEGHGRTIEVIGDSITSGFGNMISDGSGDYTTATEEGTMTYAVLAAKELSADVSIISRSGIGFCRGSETMDSIYEYYAKTASLPGKEANGADWDFEAKKNDVVVINLGTNDNGAQMGGSGITNEHMTDEAVAFLHLVRDKNPDAVIIWAYGLMGNGRQNAISEAVKRMNEQGDEKVFFLPLANYINKTEGQGTHGHPYMQAGINRSIVLAEFIAEKTGWEVDARPYLQAQLQLFRNWNEEMLSAYTKQTADKLLEAIAAGESLLEENAGKEQYAAAAQAIWESHTGLRSTEDMSGEYLVVDTMDSVMGWSFGGSYQADAEDNMEGEACLSTTYTSGDIIFINTARQIGMEMPEGWQDWYLEFWMYVDHPENIPGGSCVEVSQTVDQIEVQWELPSLGLKEGWNKVQLKLGGGNTTNAEAFQTLNNIRVFVVNMSSGPLTIKLDNIVLSKGSVAENLDDWQETLQKAEALYGTGNASLDRAYELAENAVSQADVDAFTARLKKEIE